MSATHRAISLPYADADSNGALTRQGRVTDNATGGDSNQTTSPQALKFTQRLAMVLGALGAVAAVFIALLYDLVHRLATVAGVAQDAPHMYCGYFIGLAGLVGACLIAAFPRLAAVLLAGAGIAFFADVGCWALLASPFLVAAAILAVSKHREDHPGSAAWAGQAHASNWDTTGFRRDDGLGIPW
jgi:hypothetical protein